MIVNLIPLAGEGSRYKNQGFKIPKPLIEINGIPMIVRAANALPKADLYIFICRKSHLEESNLKSVLHNNFQNLKIIEIDYLTEGQAITCQLAEQFIPENAILNVGACDNDMIYNLADYNNIFLNNLEIDATIWTFTNNPTVEINPKMYGWVKVENSIAKGVSCKSPISETPINDQAIVGAFSFKNAKIFFDSIRLMIKDNIRIKNEFYVDVALDVAIKNGVKVNTLQIDNYVCWGTPQDYRIFNLWFQYFQKF